MKDLLEIRNEIDQIDSQIVELYEKRMKCTTEVAEYKIATGKKIFDKKREEIKLEKVRDLASDAFNKQSVRELFLQIMSMSRKRQYQLLTERGLTEKIRFSCVDHLDYTGARVVFQGVEGAYSEAAMKEFFGKEIDSFHVETWRDAMEAIRERRADYAVLPIENSSAGSVSENYDLLVEYDNCCIVGEQIIQIEHVLLGLPEAAIEDIQQIYSHPQALMQCSKILEEHREWEKISLKNTAVSAKKLKEDDDKTQAAIASRLTANLYGLEILKENLSNNKNNCTRFIVVTGRHIYERKAEKISICFEIPHESGSLYEMLSHFIFNGINMTKIESRPIQGRNWEYRFFIDFEGNLNDGAVQNALRGLEEETNTLKILGNY
ncbi:MAG: prephenate dehydratase [Lachnospiraceae bacterium]|nr:prephenate dehydratase [Lachnospiraceae bacterium]